MGPSGGLAMATREELLEKMVAGTLSRGEALELRGILQKEDRESKLRLLAAMGIGAAAAMTLPPLLEMELGDLLDLRMEPQVLAVEPQASSGEAARRPGLRQHPPEQPESPEEEALEVAREARTPGQVGAQEMAQPQEMGAPVRRVRARRR
jgi:hypothetical protein